ncbi:hypothetical protein V1291_002008 [Nitrobacteraceae bacterium AZCC 1564]
MRRLLIALAIVLVSAQAHAQMDGGKHRRGGSESSASDADKRKRMAKEEAAAKAAMKTVPDSNEKYDPWKIGK